MRLERLAAGLRRRAGGWGPDCGAAVLLALWGAALLWDPLFTGRVFFARDIQLMWYTQVEAFVRSVHQGSWPLWNPYQAFGQPLLADANNQLLYPLTWLHLLVRPWTYYKLFAIAHLFFAGLGLFRLARRMDLSRAGALAGAALWMGSGPLVSAVGMWNQLAGLAWVPWILLAADSLVRTASLRSAASLGAAGAMPILVGSPESAVMAFVGVLARACLILDLPSPGVRARPRRILLLSGVAALCAATLSLGQLLPSWELSRRSARQHLEYGERTYWSVHPLHSAEVLLPARLDRLPLASTYRTLLFDRQEPFLASLSVGLPSLILVLAALSRRRRLAALLATLVVLAFLLALGRHTPAYDIAVRLLPPLRMLRYPAKAMFGLSLAWALLAALGFDALRDAKGRLGRRGVALLSLASLPCALAALAAGILFFNPEALASVCQTIDGGHSLAKLLRAHAVQLAMAAVLGALALGAYPVLARLGHPASYAPLVTCLALAALFAEHGRLNDTAPRALFTYRPAALDAIDCSDHSRLYSYDYFVAAKMQRHLGRTNLFEWLKVPDGWSVASAQALVLRTILFPPSAGAWGIEGSYDHDTTGNYALPLARVASLPRMVENPAAQLRLLQLGGVSHVLALHQAGFEALTLKALLDSRMPDPLRVLRVPDYLPRTYVVGGVRPAPEGADDRLLLLSADFDPRREIIVYDPVPWRSPDARGTSRLLSSGTDRVRLEVETDLPAFVVLLDSFDPGWHASVDGQPRPILRANVAFRAVAVPGGRHSVELVYRPRAVVVGLATTGVAALLLGVLLAWPQRRQGAAPSSRSEPQ